MVSITGITWIYAAVISLVLSVRMMRGLVASWKPILFHFTAFFFVIAFAFVFFGLPLFSDDVHLLKTGLLVGHTIMWIAFALFANVLWHFGMPGIFSRWLMSGIVVLGGALQVYLEFINERLPEVVHVAGPFVVMQWNLSASSMAALTVTLWAVTIPVGIYFYRKARELRGNFRRRSYGFAIAFIFASVAGVLSTYHQPLGVIVTETLLSLFGFFGLTAATIFSPRIAAQEGEGLGSEEKGLEEVARHI